MAVSSVNAGAGRLVSVVIPTFNRGYVIGEAIESCLAQTHRPIEVVVVDDGSTDDTREKVERRAAADWQDAGVRYIRQQNAGASSARNHGMRLSIGSYLQFLDSDDLLLPEKIAKQVAALEQPGSEQAVCCHCYGVLESAQLPGQAANRIGFASTDPRGLCERLCDRQVLALGTPGPLWRTSWLSANRGWREDIALGDDLEFHVRLLTRAARLQFVDEALFIVREHRGERLSSASRNQSAIESQLRAFMAVRDSMIEAGWWSPETQSGMLRSARTLYATALALRDGEMVDAVEAWLELLASEPRKRKDIKMIIAARRAMGGRVLLIAHRLLMRAGWA
jgi:glycosyltransferase involved in cell wall biosynthesis